MKFKLIVVMVADEKTDLITETARACGATGWFYHHEKHLQGGSGA